MSLLHERLHYQPAPQVWPQSSRQTSTFPVPPPRKNYGSKEQLVEEEDTSPKLNNEGIKSVQAIVGAILYHAKEFHNRLLVSLSAIGSQQASATEQTTAAIDQVLDHVATYPHIEATS